MELLLNLWEWLNPFRFLWIAWVCPCTSYQCTPRGYHRGFQSFSLSKFALSLGNRLVALKDVEKTAKLPSLFDMTQRTKTTGRNGLCINHSSWIIGQFSFTFRLYYTFQGYTLRWWRARPIILRFEAHHNWHKRVELYCLLFRHASR